MDRIQMSETLEVGTLLALAGGFMDAYSYLCRGKVFANAQTGNMLLLGVSVSEGNWESCIRYAAPVLCFAIGVIVAELIRHMLNVHTSGKIRLHWRQLTLLFEILTLAVVAFIPQSLNLLANSITSMACGMQVESFRKIHGNGVATTMCIGNLRSGTENMCKFFYHRDEHTKEPYLRRALLYYGVIICFVLGAVLGHYSCKHFADRAILLDAGILIIAFFMMFAAEKAPGLEPGTPLILPDKLPLRKMPKRLRLHRPEADAPEKSAEDVQ